jgi:hypothetical protein
MILKLWDNKPKRIAITAILRGEGKFLDAGMDDYIISL